MNNVTENRKSNNHSLFKQSSNQPRCRSKSAYATMKFSGEHRYGYTLNENERGFLRQVLVSSGMGKGEMLALLG